MTRISTTVILKPTSALLRILALAALNPCFNDCRTVYQRPMLRAESESSSVVKQERNLGGAVLVAGAS